MTTEDNGAVAAPLKKVVLPVMSSKEEGQLLQMKQRLQTVHACDGLAILYCYKPKLYLARCHGLGQKNRTHGHIKSDHLSNLYKFAITLELFVVSHLASYIFHAPIIESLTTLTYHL